MCMEEPPAHGFEYGHAEALTKHHGKQHHTPNCDVCFAESGLRRANWFCEAMGHRSLQLIPPTESQALHSVP